RPSLLCNNAPSLRAITPTPRGGTETPQLSPRSLRLSATKQCVSSSSRPTPAPVGDLLTTLQCSLHATARRVACPPGLVRPGVFLRPPRTYTPELARGRSPAPRVGYDYTALLGKDDERTCTGWSTAVTGCAFCRNFSRSIYPTLSRVKSSGGAAYLLSVTGLIACTDARLFDASSCPWTPPSTFGKLL